MILIDNIFVDEDITNVKFSCDLNRCKGACCTFPGELGAPVLDSEIKQIEAATEAASVYLSKKSLEIIKSRGVIEGTPGDYSTVCINKKDCVFVYYEGAIAKCSLERAYFDGKSDFRKPISCHLFPIRIRDKGGPVLYYQRIQECSPAIDKGEKDKIVMYKFLEEALVRKYGEEWYRKFIGYMESKNL